MNSQNKNTGFLMLLLLAQAAFAGKEFDIYPVGQEKTQWCWAACCEMVFDAYQISPSVDQYDVANWAVGGRNEVNTLGGDTKSVDAVLRHFGSIECHYIRDLPTGPGILTKQELSAEIDIGRPIIAQVAINGGQSYHDVLIRGYTGPSGSNMTNVIFNDPAYGGLRRVFSYELFVKDGESGWDETLTLVTKPRDPIPLGFDDWVRIVDGGTTTITPSTTSLSYTAVFHNADTWPTHPVSWDWKLIFVHSGGECIARSWTSTSTASELTWNISGFSLPTGYEWYYNYSGKIPGRVELDLFDSDGYHHLDAINVLYVPTNLYPGIVLYKDKTISTSQPDVKAHEAIVMQNDLFNSGTNIDFKSGGMIDIEDGVTINNGSSVDFIVDPAYW